MTLQEWRSRYEAEMMSRGCSVLQAGAQQDGRRGETLILMAETRQGNVIVWEDGALDLFACMRDGSRVLVAASAPPGVGDVQEGLDYIASVVLGIALPDAWLRPGCRMAV